MSADLEKELAATKRELERWKRGEQVEGDYVCEDGSIAMSHHAELHEVRAELGRVLTNFRRVRHELNTLRKQRDEALAEQERLKDQLAKVATDARAYEVQWIDAAHARDAAEGEVKVLREALAEVGFDDGTTAALDGGNHRRDFAASIPAYEAAYMEGVSK